VSGLAIPVLETLESVRCATCGILFGITSDYMRRRRDDHGDFSCPSGHINVYRGQSETDRLRAELANEQHRTAYEKRMREYAEKNAKGARIAAGMAKASLGRTMTRVRAGVCPHCQRTFKQLAAHMKCKHGAKK